MKKQTLVLMTTCVIAILTSTVCAQISQPSKIDTALKPAKESILQKYIDISSLPPGENRKAFSNLSASDKAALVRFHLSFQLANRQNLTQQQKDQIREAMSLVTPEMYSNEAKKRVNAQQQAISLAQKAKILFTGEEILEIFGSVGANPKELGKLKKYEELSPYDFDSRRQLFKNSTITERTDAWDIHCAVFLAERPELNAYQQALIVGLFDFINAELFEIHADNPKWENKVGQPISEILKRAQALFSKEDTISLFSELGGTRGTSSLRSPESPTDDCQCHRGSGDMCAYDCAGTNCTVWSFGCGAFWILTCNGAACNEIPILN